MRRLVYSPKVYAFVRTDEHPKGVNISDWIVRGNVHRRTNAASTATIELRNPHKMWTTPGKPFFRPMDPITIFLTRLKGRPVQVFTGYLDTTPYLQLFPGTVTLTATCTLKRLMHTYWDPSLPYVFDGFLREYGWNLDPKTGQMFSDDLYDGPELDKAGRKMNDGSLGALLFATMKHVARWDSQDIYIEKLPDGIVDKVTNIYNSLAKENEGIQSNIKTLLSTMLGTGSMGDGGGPLAPADETTTRGELIGSAMTTAYGPPWDGPNGMQGSGVTAGGTDLRDGKRRYIVAADNTRFPLGTRLYIEPNPYNYKGSFLVDDTGGWFKPGSSRAGGIDFYIAEGRAKQLEWGKRPVNVYKADKDDDKKPRKEEGAAPENTATPKGNDSTTRWDAILAEANRIAKIGTIYTYAGGHSTPVPKGGPWDCSSAISALLQAAGYDVPTFATPSAPSILRPGKGKRITFWNNANPGRGGHIYAVIDGKRWGAESGQNTGWLSGEGQRAGYQPFTVPGGEDTLDEPYDIPAGADTSAPGGGGGSGGSGSAGGTTNASAFAAYLNLPGALDTAEAIGLAGKKSLLNDQPLFPFIQQLCQSTLRSFQSMPNGNFFAFFPDYFGGFGHRTPYWLVDDVEILDGGIDLTDEWLATHVYIVGDNNFDFEVNFLDRLQSGGVMDIESAFKSSFLQPPKDGQTGGLGVTHEMSRNDVLDFLRKYGVRPYKEELPMIRNPYYEAFLAYQKFMELWSKQFSTKFQFTFMPELYPGGLVGLNDHGIQCYVEEVIHSFDYESGFTTEAILSSPAAMKHGPDTDISGGMIRAFDFKTTHKPKSEKQHVIPPRIDGPFGGPHWNWSGRKS